ncbi:MAG: hypothetical protein IJK64_02905 [Clostridia bacterium]|nr:hypothetical protein [Clostridia bacterium]
MKTFYLIMKTILVSLTVIGLGNAGFAPRTGGGDFAPSAPVPGGDEEKYLQITAEDAGIDIFQPCKQTGGYHYGPSMILNRDGCLDVWCAATGPGDIVDVVSYFRLFDEGRKRSRETVAVHPTPETEDWKWTCDPGVIKFGDYYYIGYTSTLDERGTDNSVYIARSKNPDGPFEKWTGSGWGVAPVVPLIKYTDDPNQFGSGEPSFVLMGDTLYIYYSWNTAAGSTTRVATADATDENWPATLVHHGECIPPKDGGDSCDVKYADAFGRFLAVFTEKRFSDDSYVSVWESFDGIRFRPCGCVKDNTMKKLHNCGISGRADGHIGAGDPVYLAYAYGSDWGNWPTRFHRVQLSLSDAPDTDPAAQTNIDQPPTRRNARLIPEVTLIKAEKQVYHVTDSAKLWVMAFDSDCFSFPLLFGTRFDGYDRSVIRISGGRIYAVGKGSTRVQLHWNGLHGDFFVYVD